MTAATPATSTGPSCSGCSRRSTRACSRSLAAYDKPRADLNAILLTGIPEGVVDGFQNYTGPVESDMLRLNVAVPPSDDPNDLGLVGGDAAGFPNGRRINDDVVTIELRAIAGQTIPLVDPSYEPDDAASAVTDGTSNTNAAVTGALPVPRAAGRGLPDRARHDAGVMNTPTDDSLRSSSAGDPDSRAGTRTRTRTPGRAW